MNRTSENTALYTIISNNQEHSLHKSHNEDFEKSKYLFSLFQDNTVENADKLIIDFANNHCDFMVHCYIANTFETTADAFMLSVMFNKKKVIETLLESNTHKLDKLYGFGLGLMTTPRELLI